MGGPTLYEILGIHVKASFKDIRKAYLRKVVSEHPDKGGTTESFERVQNAYKTLSNPDERIIYDENVLGQRISEEDEYRYPSSYHTSAHGVTVECHGQTCSRQGHFRRKGESYAGQGKDVDLLELNRVIEEGHRHHHEDPTHVAYIRELAIAYLDRAVYHLNHNKQNHALFDAYEAEHLYPDIFKLDHVPASAQQVAQFLARCLDDDDHHHHQDGDVATSTSSISSSIDDHGGSP